MEAPDCREAERLLSAFVDNELDVVTSCSIQEHLDLCPRCRARHAWEIETRGALKRLSDAAPPTPRALRRRARKPPRGARRKVLVPLTAAAVAILALTFNPLPHGAPEAASPMEFVENHLSSLERPDAVAFASNDARAAQTWLRERLRFPIKVPQQAPAGYRLYGARHCQVGGNRVGYLLYAPVDETEREFVSIFIGQLGSCDGGELTETKRVSNLRFRRGERGGTLVTSWDSEGLTYVTAGAIDESALSSFAQQQALAR